MPEDANALPPWMKALGLLILAAALANAAIVWLALRNRRDLVRSDYYQAGLEQDARMLRRGLAASYGISLTVAREGWSVRAETLVSESLDGRGPAEAALLKESTCRVRFSRPNDGRQDRVVELAWIEGETFRWHGPGHPLKAGRWDVLVEWEKDGKVFMESAFPRYHHE